MGDVVSDLIGGVSGIAGSLLNYELNDRTNDENIENQWQMFHANQRYQNKQNLEMYSTLRRSLEGAGLNVNANFGGYPTTSAPSSSLASKTAPQIDSVGIANLLQTAPLISAQTRKENADAEKQEIENERERQTDSVINKFFYDRAQEEKKKKSATVDENGNLQFDKDGGNLDEVDVSAPWKRANKGRLTGEQFVRRWKSENYKLDADDVKNQVDKLVSDQQLGNSAIIRAIASMPYRDYQRLCNEITVLAKQPKVMDSVIKLNEAQAHSAESVAALNELQKKIQENSSLVELIHKYLGDGPMADAAMFIAIVCQSLMGSFSVAAKL